MRREAIQRPYEACEGVLEGSRLIDQTSLPIA